MKSQQKSWLIVVVMLVLICMNKAHAFSEAGTGSSSQVLWQIGKSDNNTADLALGPSGHGQFAARFSKDVVYIIGRSNARQDWPYIQPGPADVWAGSRSHTFTILFGLVGQAGQGDCKLILDFVDTHSSVPPELQIEINGKVFQRQTPKGAGDDSAHGQPEKGRECVIAISFPAKLLHAGNNRIAITTASGSWLLYDSLKLTAPAEISLDKLQPLTRCVDIYTAPYLVYGRDKSLRQPILARLQRIGPAVTVSINIDNRKVIEEEVGEGVQVVAASIPAISKEQKFEIEVISHGRSLGRKSLLMKPVRKWELYLLHHTHLDIGYTHVQTEVAKKQWGHLEQAIELGKASKNNPEGERFIWHPEGLWAIDSYLRQASPARQKAFIDAVRKGYIHLDALYGNELTALCRPEELFELTGFARRLESKYNLTIDSAMITDVPGYTWGIVPVLAYSGVKYLSIGPNYGFRIGYTLSSWGDKPFYWVSPSGKEKILCWMAGRGYSWFHTGLNYKKLVRKLQPERFFNYLEELEKAGYPYDMVQIRYNIGSDNGPPDPHLAEFVKSWNRKYAYPRMIIADNSKMFREFEARYGERIPRVRGDFTPYWEDGAGSSARETAINRATAERLVQAATLWSMLDARRFPQKLFDEAWRNTVLYDEHTWGAWNSISDPKSDFAQGQWKIKQAFALDAEKQSRSLLHQLVGPVKSQKAVATLQVFNTSSWVRSDLVILDKELHTAGDLVKNGRGEILPSQRLSDGRLAFLLRNVPPLGSVKVTFQSGSYQTENSLHIDGNELFSDSISLKINPRTGAISYCQWRNNRHNYVLEDNGTGLNDYLYVAGRKPADPQRVQRVKITPKEKGPLVASLLVEADAAGCNKLTREVRLVSGLDRVDIIDILDKKEIFSPEGVYLAFPFNVPGGQIRMDVPWAVVRPDKDQIKGACKNYFTIQHWVDVSNDELGITWASPDAPLVELGKLNTDARVVGWLKKTEPTTVVYSYVMNNYWETNYKAAQKGKTVFRYFLKPHLRFDSAEAMRFACEQSQPLIAIPREEGQEISSLFKLADNSIIVTSIRPSRDNESLMIRLFNCNDKPAPLIIQWQGLKPQTAWLSDARERSLVELSPRQGILMKGFEIVTLKVR